MRTFNWVDALLIPIPLEEVLVSQVPLTLLLLADALVFSLEVLPATQALVVVEYDGAYRLLSPVLPYDVLIDALLQVTGVELRHPDAGRVEDGPAARLVGRVVGAREAGGEVGRASRGAGEQAGGGEGPRRWGWPEDGSPEDWSSE